MKVKATLILASLLVLASPVMAENTAAPLKIAVMDFQKILKNSPQAESLSIKLKNEFKPRQDKIVSLQKALEADQARLKRDISVMSEKEANTLRDKITNVQRDLRRMEEDYMADARTAQRKAMDEIAQKINSLIKKVADQGGYDLILQREYVAFASHKIDITDSVVKELKQTKN